jgi:hypothetical protein
MHTLFLRSRLCAVIKGDNHPLSLGKLLRFTAAVDQIIVFLCAAATSGG